MAMANPKSDATQARLDAMSMPEGAAWMTAARREALDRVTASGLPGRRDEYWKYTNPADLVAPSIAAVPLLVTGEQEMFSATDRLRIVFVDGVFDAAQSDELAMDGVEIELLRDVAQKDIHWAKDLYGTLETEGQTPVSRPLAALNTAFATDGVCIRVHGQASRPISIVMQHADEHSDVVMHNLVRVEKGASLTLLECGPVAARFNGLLEVDVQDGGRFNHVRTQGRTHARRALTHIFGRLGEECHFKSFTLTANGMLTRNECVLRLTGRDTKAHVAGAAVGDGDFLQDDTVFITHDAVGCESRQVFKKVLRNGATGVFQGKILVNEIAQKTDGFQMSQALLLGDDAQFLAKPELEIYADDVACSHGSTSGAIDDTALFYLRSRGVPKTQAEELLVLAFVAEAIDEIEDSDLAENIRVRMDEWLVRHRN